MCFRNCNNFNSIIIYVSMFGAKIHITECFKNLDYLITSNRKDIDIHNIMKDMKTSSNII